MLRARRAASREGAARRPLPRAQSGALVTIRPFLSRRAKNLSFLSALISSAAVVPDGTATVRIFGFFALRRRFVFIGCFNRKQQGARFLCR